MSGAAANELAVYRRFIFDDEPSFSATVAYYHPNVVHDRHQHDWEQLSWLLAGDVLDDRSGHWVRGQGVRRLSPGVSHRDQFGPRGALVLSLRISSEVDGSRELSDGWRAAPTPAVLGCLADADEAVAASLLCDVAVATLPERAPRAGAPPAWLKRAAEALSEEGCPATITALADQKGLHRSTFHRVFREWFGIGPGEYALRAKTAGAIGLALGASTRMSDVAAAQGFADQAHMNKTVRRRIGLTPGRLRRLLGCDNRSSS